MCICFLQYSRSMKLKNTLQFIPLEGDMDQRLFHLEDGYSFPNETFVGLAALCTILKDIHDRLTNDGYSIMHKVVKEAFEVNGHEQNITHQ